MNQIRYIFLLLLVFCLSCKNIKDQHQIPEVIYDTLTTLKPVVITEPTLNDTDDPAIWVNKDNPSESLVLGTDKGDSTGGIYVYQIFLFLPHNSQFPCLKM